METTITAAELAKRLSDVLNRVKYRGERFVVQPNGETIATVVPAHLQPGITIRALIDRIGDARPPGEGFADDLEAVQASQEPARMPEWPG